MNNIKVSVVVPVHNTEEYLDRCLKSLTNQSLKDIEIIIINDGSTDNSQKIIDYYKCKYPNIKSFTTKNMGLSCARNLGVSFCVGEYIGFVDSDDYVEEDMYERMFQLANDNDLDIVGCDYNEIYTKHMRIQASGIFSSDNKLDMKKSLYYIIPTVWNKIYKRSLLENTNITFTKGIHFEDVDFTYRLLPHIKSTDTVQTPLYNYNQRQDSISHQYNSKNLNDITQIWNNLFDYYKTNNIFMQYRDELEYSYFRYIYNMFDRMSSADKEQHYESFKDQLNTHIPEPHKNRLLRRILPYAEYNIFCSPLRLNF